MLTINYTEIRKAITSAYKELGESAPEVSFDTEKGQVMLLIDGDWYHDHGHANSIMRRLGFDFDREDVVDESEEDWYESYHVFNIN